MRIHTTVKEPFTHTFGSGSSAYQVEIPTGTSTLSASAHGGGFRWVDPYIFPEGSIERHDADHRGIPVPLSNIDFWET
jgi:hypothetical protein